MAYPSLLSGVIGVRVRINELGEVCQAELSPQSGRGRLDRGLLISARRWSFNAPRRDGRAACVDSTFRFRFDPSTLEESDFDTPPEPLHMVPAQYPRIAKRQGATGTIYLDVWIDETGVVSDAILQHSEGRVAGEPALPALITAAIEAARGWQFKPALLRGQPVPCVIEIPFRFSLD